MEIIANGTIIVVRSSQEGVSRRKRVLKPNIGQTKDGATLQDFIYV